MEWKTIEVVKEKVSTEARLEPQAGALRKD
jgi:hypothetical protein